MTPRSKPQAKREDIEVLLKERGISFDKTPVVLVGVRGYYLDSMGKAGKNDRGIYDDALFWVTKDLFASFNANTDPSRFRKGKGRGSGKGMASLNTGVWQYKTGVHNGSKPHPAFRQYDKVTVTRDGSPSYEDTGHFGINIHRGGVNGTSSLGCQTIPPAQWPAFKELGYQLIKEHGLSKFPYVLINETDRKKTSVVPKEVPVKKTESLKLTEAVKLVKEFEGLYLKAYKDPVGIPTIGFGTIKYPNGVKVKMGDTCTEAQATEWLIHEFGKCIDAIKKNIKVPLTTNETCALISWSYNVGVGPLKTSTLVKKLNAGAKKAEVAAEFHRWNKAKGKVFKGLVRRRAAEASLFLKGE